MITVFRLLSARPKAVLTFAALLAAAGALASSRLELRTSFSELLPDDDAGVVALRATQERMGDLTLLLVGIRSPDPAANQRYAEALTQHLHSLPRAVCEIAAYHVRDLHQFFQDNRWLYASERDLEDVRDRIRREIGRRKNPLFVDLGGDEGDDEDQRLEQRLRKQGGISARFPDGVFQNEGGTTVWVVALPPGGLLVENAGVALLSATQAFIGANPPSRFHAQMDVEPAGPIITTLRNRDALARDLVLVGGLCGLLIPLSMGLFFRRLRAVLFVSIPAALATVLAYAVAYLAFGYLTTVTSFLISFIMGNGTNYAIVLLAHYEDRRRRGLSAQPAAFEAVSAVWGSTGVATVASALSYLSLMLTSFRGFSQFGVIGAAGCLFAWVATFTVLPALLCLFDRRGPAPFRVAKRGLPLLKVARFVERSPGKVLLAGSAITAVMVVGLARFGTGAFEYDFRKLSARGTVDERTRSFNKDKDDLFGRWPEPTVILADRAEDVATVKQAIRRADAAAPGSDVIGQMVSVQDLLPGDGEVQERKLQLLAQIRKSLDDPALELLEDEKKRRELRELRPPDSLRVVSAKDLPALARRPFTEAGGIIGRVILFYPPEQGVSVWDGVSLLRIASVVQRVYLPDGRELATSGTAVIFAAMIRSIVRDGPLATVVSLGAVILLVLLRVRPLKAALFVIGGLLVGVTWMVGTAAWLGLKITFLNFIALPFIFGVGVEYAIHVVTEYQHHRSVRQTIVSAGGPVALCSWSAIVGYGSLLAASNGALRGLGGVATLGEVTCLLAAVVVTPAALSWRRVRAQRARQRDDAATAQAG